MVLVIFKGNRFYQKGLFDINAFQKKQNLYTHIPQKSDHKKHRFTNYVLNELKQYNKYNSEKLDYLKLRNNFFGRFRNRGFIKYLPSKIFISVSYSSRNKYLLTNEKFYSTAIHKTRAKALIKV